MKKILFISHDDTLTGAPVLLLNLIRLIKLQTAYSVKIIIKNQVGVLVNEFESESDVLNWQKLGPQRFSSRFSRKLMKSLKVKTKNEKKIQAWIDESDIVVSNTITNGDFLQAFNFSQVKLVLSYIHELEMATRFYSTAQDVDAVKRISHRFIVPSKAVALHLVNNLQIAEGRISTLQYYVPLAETALPLATDSRQPFIVGLIGTLDWRKGSDILSVVIAAFFKKYPGADLLFVWKGANKSSVEYERIIYELGRLNLADKIRFDASSKVVNDFYQSIDVLLLISKEDPYPLVVLEAASNYKPSICFSSAGGAPEFTGNDAGDSVPYLDIAMLADKLFACYTDRSLCRAKGNVAFGKYKALHFNSDLILHQFEEALTV